MAAARYSSFKNFDELSILLVEDRSEDQELFLKAFRKNGFNNIPHIVKDGVEAIQHLAKIWTKGDPLPDLIVLDLQIPKYHGLEVLEHIRREPRTRGIPVIVLSSSQEILDVAEAFRLGVAGYLVKPIDFHQFVREVGKLKLFWNKLHDSATAASSASALSI